MTAMHSIRRSLLVLALLAAAAPTARSADWVQTSLPMGYRYALAAAPTGEVFAFGGGAVHRSLDEGLTWAPVGQFAPNAQPHTLVRAASGELFAGDFAVGLFRSSDGGVTWSTSLVDEGCNGLAVGEAGLVFAGLTYTGNGRVHRSADAGANWQSIALPGSTPSFSTECFAFGGGGLVYAGAIDGFYRSSDDGLTWQASSSGLAGRHVRTMAAAANGHLFVHTLLPAQIDGLYRSIDGGATWQKRVGNAPYFSALVAAPDGSLIGVSEEQVVRSTDEGLVWSDLAAGIPANEQLHSLAVTPSGHLLAGGYRVHRLASAVLDAPRAEAPRPALRVQPNPATGPAQITFSMPRAGAVELAVFDLAGRRVKMLAQGRLAAGEHVRVLERAGLRPGVYRCRLASDGGVTLRSLVVLD